jgi:hypothetical protein
LCLSVCIYGTSFTICFYYVIIKLLPKLVLLFVAFVLYPHLHLCAHIDMDIEFFVGIKFHGYLRLLFYPIMILSVWLSICWTSLLIDFSLQIGMEIVLPSFFFV